jgi:hypothetical protein
METLRSLINLLKTGLHHQQGAQPVNIKREQQVRIQLKKLMLLHPKVETWKQLKRYLLFQIQITFNEKLREQPYLSQFWSDLLIKMPLRRRKDQTWRKRKRNLNTKEGASWYCKLCNSSDVRDMIQCISAGHGFMCTVPKLDLSRSAITAMIEITSVHRTNDAICIIVYPLAYLIAQIYICSE